MDPLSITASIISITTAAVQSVHILTKTIDNIKDAPDTVKGVSTDLAARKLVLQSLQRSFQAGTSEILFSNQIKRAIKNCDRACNAFSLQVGRWTRRSKEDKMFWIDKWRVALFGLERIKTFRAQLGEYKAILSVALSTTTVITNSQQENPMKEMKDLMLQQNKVIVRQQLARAYTAIVELEVKYNSSQRPGPQNSVLPPSKPTTQTRADDNFSTSSETSTSLRKH